MHSDTMSFPESYTQDMCAFIHNENTDVKAMAAIHHVLFLSRPYHMYR